jgi:hypothetical protein
MTGAQSKLIASQKSVVEKSGARPMNPYLTL